MFSVKSNLHCKPSASAYDLPPTFREHSIAFGDCRIIFIDWWLSFTTLLLNRWMYCDRNILDLSKIFLNC